MICYASFSTFFICKRLECIKYLWELLEFSFSFKPFNHTILNHFSSCIHLKKLNCSEFHIKFTFFSHIFQSEVFSLPNLENFLFDIKNQLLVTFDKENSVFLLMTHHHLVLNVHFSKLLSTHFNSFNFQTFKYLISCKVKASLFRLCSNELFLMLFFPSF